ncbi:MAG: tetratricopeptide repeat protein [Aquabacterium sp.]|uniref:O-linked N-acetylglucosamine transferase, SPINDLY family protein n=1 Tax=Aquabacterium sp. TaxID=1872578 RepID=UPI003BEE859E
MARASRNLIPHSRGGVSASTSNAKRAHQLWSDGLAYKKAGKWLKACASFKEAVKLEPHDALYWLNLAHALNKLGQRAEAMDAARTSLKLDPANLVTNHLLVQLYRDQKDPAEALAVLNALPPDVTRDERHHVLTGACLAEMGKHQEAISHFLNALQIKHDDKEAYSQLGFSLMKLRQHAQAAECFRTLAVLDPTALDVAMYAVHYSAWACDWDMVDHDKGRLADTMDLLTEASVTEPISPFCLLSISDDPELQKWMAMWDMRRYRHIHPQDPGHYPKRDTQARIKVGMVSCDFHHHATSMLLVEVLERLDRQKFEVFLYSHGPDDGSALRRRVVASADHFVECAKMLPREQADRIRADGIDVLFELKGFTQDTRLATFAFRPAPIQVAWLGYPGTCGAPFIDYIIGDPMVTPLSSQSAYTEHIAQMPICYQPNDSSRHREVTRTRHECGLPPDAIVMACFNQSYKITRELFDSWCRILQRVPAGVLWLLVPDDAVRQRLRLEAARRGISPDRLYFADFEQIDRHRQRIALADLALDTFPCGGHTTTSDTLWSGVPVVSLMGQTFASRVAGSLLSAVGLPELICQNFTEYENKAVALAQETELRAAMRQALLDARDSAPLFDSSRFASDLGHLMQRMVERVDQGLPPASLPAEKEPV